MATAQEYDISIDNMKCLNGQSKADSGNDNDQSKTEHAVAVVEEN
jgi:hypothetical protein